MKPSHLIIVAACSAAAVAAQAQSQAPLPDSASMQGERYVTSSAPATHPTSSKGVQNAPVPPLPAVLRTLPGSTGAQAPVAGPRIEPAAPPPLTAVETDVFGAQLFTGAFAREGATLFNPDYLLATGDTVQVRLWGAFEHDMQLVVDPQGNVFLPHVGPVQVRGVRNRELQATVDQAVRRIFRANVSSYASLAAAQPVRIFVSGYVSRPGLYSGTSMDSLLHYLDQAGGIDPDRGTFLDVQVQRYGQSRAHVNLYDFLLRGVMPSIQLASGDVIFVPPRRSTVKVSGLAGNAKRFEFNGASRSVAEMMDLAKPQPSATHVRVIRNTGTVRNLEYYGLQDAAAVSLANGDEIEFTADKKPGTITVRMEGEHQSAQEYVLPYGTRLGELLQRIQPNSRSDMANLQLFRQSVKQRQKDMLASSLRSLESALLTARSGSSDEARLRKDEADLTLAWVARAKSIEPLGQVLIAQAADKGELLLENGDVLRIPTQDHIVLVGGEVLFPNAIAFQQGLSLNDYIQRAGGFTQNADNSRVVVARRDGSFEQADTGHLLSVSPRLQPGDQVLVLPRVDEKRRQFWKDMTQILYQIAVSAKVVLGL